jgi:small basic protein
MKLTQNEWSIIGTGLSAIVFPLIYTIIRRHYDQRPDDWERFFVRLVIALVYVGITILGVGLFIHAHSPLAIIFSLGITVVNGFAAYEFIGEAKEAFEQANRPADK